MCADKKLCCIGGCGLGCHAPGSECIIVSQAIPDSTWFTVASKNVALSYLDPCSFPIVLCNGGLEWRTACAPLVHRLWLGQVDSRGTLTCDHFFGLFLPKLSSAYFHYCRK